MFSTTASFTGSGVLTAAVQAVGGGGMSPPAGATLRDDLTLLSAWTVQQDNATISELAGPGPAGDVILRNTLVDGQKATWDGANGVERSDMMGPVVPLNGVSWMVWHMRVVQLPADLSTGGFQMLGPCEIHGHTLPQATVQPVISAAWTDGVPLGRHAIEANAGSASHDWRETAPVDLGNWHQWKLGVYYTQSGTGWAELWRDGVMVFRKDGATTGEAEAGYWKFPNYRDALIQGTTQYDISSCKVYSA